MISSEALVFETERNPNVTRREYVLEVLSKTKLFVASNDQIENRAKELNAIGIKPLDSLHLASSEEAQADYFCTCDDKLLNRAKVIKDIRIKIISPIELVKEIEK